MAFVFRAKKQLNFKENNSKVYLEPDQQKSKPNLYAFNSTLKKQSCAKNDNKIQKSQSAQQIYYAQKQKERDDIMQQINQLNNQKKQSLFGKQQRFQDQNQANEVSYNFDKEKLCQFKKQKKIFQEKQFQYLNNDDKYYKQIPSIQKVLKVKSVLDNELQEYEQRKKQIIEDIKKRPVRGVDWKNTTKKTVSLKQFKQAQDENYGLDRQKQNKSKKQIKNNGQIYYYSRQREYQGNQQDSFQVEFEDQNIYDAMKQYQLDQQKKQEFQYQFFNSSVPRFQNDQNTQNFETLINTQYDIVKKQQTHNQKKDFKFGQQQQRFITQQQICNTDYYLPHQNFLKKSFNKTNVFIVKDQKFKQQKEYCKQLTQLEKENQSNQVERRFIKKQNFRQLMRKIKNIPKKKSASVSQLNVQNLNISYNLNNIQKKNMYLQKINKKLSFGSEKERFNLKKFQKIINQNKKLGQIEVIENIYHKNQNTNSSFGKSQRFNDYKDLSNQKSYNITQKWQKQSFNVFYNPNQFFVFKY